MTTDLIIVGAGAAGLSAAKAAARSGLSFRVIEAKGRVGGRAWTESATLGLPMDHGAHFLHAASVNPLRAYADHEGATYLTGGYRSRVFSRGWLDEAQQQAFEVGAKAALDRVASGDHDERHSVQNRWPADFHYGALMRGFYEEFLGAPAEDVAAAEHRRYLDTYEDWPVKHGFGALIARFGANVPVILDCPVTEIDTRASTVVVRTPRGDLSSRHAIVTISTGVMAAQGIRFRPGLPIETEAALASVPMGYAGKVAFRCDDTTLAGAEPVHALISAPDGRFANIHIRPFGRPIVVTIVGGPDWEAIERAGSAAMQAEALRMVQLGFGSDATSNAGPSMTTNWLSDPFIRGGHSYKRPSAGNARAILAQPIHDRLHLAGEAVSTDAWATIHGAHATANEAVKRVAHLLGKSTRG